MSWKNKENLRRCFKCGRSPAEDQTITLFRFPKPGKTNTLRCELWARYCFPDQECFSPEFQHKMHSEHKMLCSRHFPRTSFRDYPLSTKKLHRFAVPDDTRKILHECLRAGISITSTVCDMDGVNRRALAILGATVEKPYITVDNVEVVTMFDPPHLLKCFRNLFMKYNIKCTTEINSNNKSGVGVAKWTHVKDFYELDNKNPNFVFAPALKPEHLNPNSKQKMRVKLAAQVLSHTVAAGMMAKISDDIDGICLSHGCCGAGARSRLTQQARSQLEQALRSELNKLADILANRARKFDEFFRKLLQLSREEFHAMFKRTYGMIYEQHSYVFEQLFEQLERYYARGDTDFDKMMDGFFGILYQKMFTVLNSQYSFDEKYLKCVSEHMRDIQPFEDVPNKLSVQLRRAFVATRTFHKALRSGADVVRNMMQVGVTQECVTAWTRLRFCGTCSGHQPPACSRYCHNVIRGCLPTHADLGEQWDAYVDAVEKVADRLLGPFNIAMVVEPIDIKISEAIMSFQEHNQEISQKIFAGCGKPVLGGGGSTGPFFAAPERTRRSPRSIPDFDWQQKGNDIDDFEIEASFESLLNDDPALLNLRTPAGIRKATQEMEEQAKSRERFLQYMRGRIDLEEYEEHERRKRDADPEPVAAGSEIDFKTYEFDGKKGGKKKKPVTKADDGHAEWGGPALERLVRETRTRVRSSRKYWSHLPGLLCSSTSVTTSPCFNGSDVASYTPGPAGEGSAALASNPEVRGLALPAGTSTARTQHDALRTLTARLKDAYNGIEVQWKDADDLQVAGTSSLDFIGSDGSGSGSGDDTDDTDDLPDDDEDRPEYGEGSGDTPPEIDEPTGTQTESRPNVPETPFVPSIVDVPGTNNVQIRGRVADSPQEPVNVDTPVDTSSNNKGGQVPPAREQPVAGSADRPSLHKALFTYALPVVCAWFGTIVTDLF